MRSEYIESIKTGTIKIWSESDQSDIYLSFRDSFSKISGKRLSVKEAYNINARSFLKSRSLIRHMIDSARV